MTSSTGRRINYAAVLILIFTILSIGMIAIGFNDPASRRQLQIRSQPTTLVIPGGDQKIQWMADDFSGPISAIRLSGAYEKGEEDSAYGIALDLGDHHLLVAVSPLGYLAIIERWEDLAGYQEIFHLKWQTWPHVQYLREANEFWIEVEGNQINVRLNREQLWSGNLLSEIQGIGLFGESYGQEVTIKFNALEVAPVE